MTKKRYSYEHSIKSRSSDEWINTYVIRPLAGILVRFFYVTPITPNQVTILSTIAGCIAAWFYAAGSSVQTIVAGLLITLKDVLDSADGQLARAKQMYSRKGRFLDSLGDLLVNVLVFGAIGNALWASDRSVFTLALAFIAFVGTTLRVSYHVYYHTSFLHLEEKYDVNRVTEEIRDSDRGADRMTLMLQRLFQICYGWQDRLMVRVDAWCRKDTRHGGNADTHWFGDATGLRLSGLLGLGTEMMVLTLFSLIDRLPDYLLFNAVVLNSVLGLSIGYRRFILSKRLRFLPVRRSDSP